MSIRLLLTNFASMASLRVGLAALTFALFWLLAQRLTTTQLGGFSLLMNVFFMVQTLPLLGMNMPVMRRIASHPDASETESSNAFFFAAPVAIVLGAALAAAGFLYRDEGLQLPFALLGLSMLPTAWIVVSECVLVGKERMLGIAYVNLFEAMGRLLGAWAVTSLNLGLTGIFEVFLVMRLAAVLAYLANRHVRRPQWRLVRPLALRLLAREAPTFLAISVITACSARLDIILLSKLLSLREAGLYAAASRLSDAALMIPTMAAVVVFPSQSRLFESDPVAFARLLRQSVRWCLIAGFVGAMLVIAASPSLIRFLYAPRLSDAAPILQILILGTTLMVVDQLLSTTMMAARAQHADLRSMVLGLMSFASLMVVLTHFFGLLGAAVAAPVSLLARVMYRLGWAQRRLHVPLRWMAVRVLLGAAAAILVLALQPCKAEYLDLALALAIYGVVLWLTQSVQASDWSVVQRIVAQRRASRA